MNMHTPENKNTNTSLKNQHSDKNDTKNIKENQNSKVINGEKTNEDIPVSGEFTKYDIRTTPAKNTIQIGETFFINVVTEDVSEYEDYTDEEWEEVCQNNIDNISFRSTKSSVAMVNKHTGEVTGKKRGIAIINTQIDLSNGESAVYKTKVYVTNAR